MKEYFANCGDTHISSNLLDQISNESESITAKEFLINCNITDFGIFRMDTEELLKNMIMYPDDFDFFEYKDIMGFTHSAVEFLFK